jgi:Na+/H+-dicarboxylate symporter
MNPSVRILIGLLAGIAVGVFLGDDVAPIKILADGFIMLLQMTVLPYVTISIVSSLGGLDQAQAKRLGLRAGAVLVGLWLIALLYCFLLPLVFPDIKTASFFTATMLGSGESFDFLRLFIPSNPFASLANGVVPAIVLFSVVLGVAIMGLERKQVLLDVLTVARTAVARVTRFVIRLTPYGIFAIAAHTAGTLRLDQFEYIQVYLLSYVVVALVLALWVLPALVSAFTPIRYREIIRSTRDALVTAFMAGDLFIVLPSLTEACKELLERHYMTDVETRNVPDVVVPASFNFPHTGKLLSLSFVLFAGWFSDAVISITQYPHLAFSGLFTFFGSPNVAVPFLLDLFRIPADTYQLFLATGLVNGRFGALVAASHTIVMGLLGTAAVVGAIRPRWPRVLRYVSITLAITMVAIGGMRLLFGEFFRPEFEGSEAVYGMSGLIEHSPSVTLTELPLPSERDSSASIIGDIGRRHVLRVGVLAKHLPFAFHNGNGELVGFDVDMAHILAQDLGVTPEFYLMDVDTLPDLLAHGTIDIAMTGLVVTPDRAAGMSLSRSYLDQTLAFVVRDHLRHDFSSWSSIRELGPVRVAIPNIPYYIRAVRDRAPELQLEVVDEVGQIMDDLGFYEALVLTAERGSVITLLHPQYAAVVPEPDLVRTPLAYPLARRDREWTDWVNAWIELKQKDGTVDALYRHWILGQGAAETRPRWSVIRDVLHWR